MVETAPPMTVKAVEEVIVRLEVDLAAPLMYTLLAPGKVAMVVVLTVNWSWKVE